MAARVSEPRVAPKGAAAPAGMTATDWNAEASELVRELAATQKEVAAMLTGQADQEKELSGMKEACSSEVRPRRRRWSCRMHSHAKQLRNPFGHGATRATPPLNPRRYANPYTACRQLAELQEETWRLQMFAELEKMKGLISQLRPIDDDAAPPADAGAPPPVRAAAAAPALAHAAAAGQKSKHSGRPLAGEQDEGSCGDGDEAEQGAGEAAALAAIDGELSVLMEAIRVAKDEVGGLLETKCGLQQQIADIYSAELDREEQDEAAAAVADGAGTDAA
jgi:hypothetical protein